MPIDSRAVAEAPGGGQKDCVTNSVTCERSGLVRSAGRTHISRMHTNRQPAVATNSRLQRAVDAYVVDKSGAKEKRQCQLTRLIAIVAAANYHLLLSLVAVSCWHCCMTAEMRFCYCELLSVYIHAVAMSTCWCCYHRYRQHGCCCSCCRRCSLPSLFVAVVATVVVTACCSQPPPQFTASVATTAIASV